MSIYPVCDYNEKEMITKKTEQRRTVIRATTEERTLNVRPHVKKMIEQKIKAHAPTWRELANR